MFDIGWSELMVIGVVALIVIGPKELPGVLRTVGKTIARLRRMAGEFQGQFQDALREAELSEMRKEIGDIADGATDSVKKSFPGMDVLDPLRSIREEIRSTVEGATKPAAVAAAATATTVASDAAPVDAAPTTPVATEPLVPLPEPADEPVIDLPLPISPIEPATTDEKPRESGTPT
ncbi:Sec-independent protein translocase protein TatB [Aquabacter sp. CN5-332]|uniref:Sec-independent protein translocase protein TatB n=1 Tax=Aquabacter sp. CN5-332 TaxID=3156608 RepID=UPI0032B38ADA